LRNRERLPNRIVYIQSALVTQNRVIQYAKDIDGREWDVRLKYTQINRENYEELAKGPRGDADAAMLEFCIFASWSPEYRFDFSGRLDNELFGVKGLEEAGLEGLMKSFL